MLHLKTAILAAFTATLFISCSKETASTPPAPTCTDGIMNQNEARVDCGGPCAPCPTCNDGVKNQDETAIDCGGTYCGACVTCSDGIQNQGETGIDCGGPNCSTCPIFYPSVDTYGPNILRDDTNTLKISVGPSEHRYSIAAKLPTGTSLKIVMSFTIQNPPVFSLPLVGWFCELGSKQGWIFPPYNQATHTEELTATGQDNCLIKVMFVNHGTLKIDFYENGAVLPIRTKTLTL